ncbi:transmembrane protein 42-like isoform X2 [Pseudochaenichthys georgianus]|uniref:transmembrane protein 42-like isoform X2 n=1 Tax=Pseudochaenichthys georgianus TaxID=52239 RepID=UPI00146C8E08|nr:transmembrane protein 42-like isoform X2 [Pseudochaenichthys georgianus]
MLAMDSCRSQSDMISGSFYAVFAGFLAATASLSAKLSLGAEHLRGMCVSGLSWTHIPGETAACDWALRHCSSSARATVTTTASNFISSAFLGRLIFGERHAALWWVGISLTLCGLLLLHGSTPHTLPPKEVKKHS